VTTLIQRHRRVLRILVSAALLGLCFSLVDPAALLQAWVRIGPGYFIVALLLNAIGTVLIRAWIAHLTTRATGVMLGFWELLRINLIARFYTIALPRGASAAIRWHHYRKGGSGHAAAALLLFENLVSVFTLFLSAALILSVEGAQAGPFARYLMPLAWCGALASAGLLLPFLHRPAAALFRRRLGSLLTRPGRVSGIARRLLTAIDCYHGLPVRRVGSILMASVLGYVFFILSAWVLARGMDLGVGLAAIAWVRSVTLLAALIPITIAGLGVREGAMIVLLGGYGVSSSNAFAYAIAAFLIQLALGLVGAILELVRVWGARTDARPVVHSAKE
jgi:uncharacterized membrane protein YbhN (UPF0104 family)